VNTGFPVDLDKLEYFEDRLWHHEMLRNVIGGSSVHDARSIKHLAMLLKPLPHHSLPANRHLLFVVLEVFLKLFLLFPPEAPVTLRVFDPARQWLRRHLPRVEITVPLCWVNLQDLGLLLVSTTTCDLVR